MKIALITGRLAGSEVRRLAAELSRPGLEIVVVELPIPVAAMMTSSYLEKELPRHLEELKDVDLIIVPGFTSGDLTRVSEIMGKPVVKGVRYLHDIPLMIDAVARGVELSRVEPADELIAAQRAERDLAILEELKKEASRNYYFTIGVEGKVYVSPLYPIILHEVYVPRESRVEDVVRSAVKASGSGADVIVLGFPLHYNPRGLRELVDSVRESTGRPVGVDSPDTLVLKEALDAGVDLLMSFTLSRLREFMDIDGLKDKAVVLIPGEEAQGQEVLDSLAHTYSTAVEHGFSKIILDPILDIPLAGLTRSLERYVKAREMFPKTPLLMGAGNITEMIDADSVGVNALIASMGVEIGVEVYLTTEASVKTRGSTRELRRALDMCLIARREKRPPKDLSINLLVLKDKRRKTTPLQLQGIVVEAGERLGFKADPKGFFRIHVDHDSSRIVVEHYKPGEAAPDYTIIGVDPKAILAEITRMQLASLPDHFFYLGYELSKASIALRIGKEYVQDEDLF
ncbi:MAG: dihydropteroate synthase-like protein [Desulfurococcus sp.]|nr:dihydropteroate synthase-like protein [Desulfurococcus sp.]